MSVERVARRSKRQAYRVRWREHGRNRARTFERRADAEAWEREVKRRQQLGPLAVQQLTERGVTLAEWIVDRWAPEHGVTLEQSTRDRYAQVHALHIAPFLDDVPLKEITVGTLRSWQAERLAAGIRPGTIQKCRTFLGSVLRHAAESEAISANPLALVRAPRNVHRDEVRPLAPSSVEEARAALLDAALVHVPRGTRSGSPRREYWRDGHRDVWTRQRDAVAVAVLAYAGLRPGELRALRWGDVRTTTLVIQRAADPAGAVKATKTRASRSVRLLAPLAQDLREWRIACGRPADSALVIAHRDGSAWTKDDWDSFRANAWRAACRRACLDPIPRPYDLRHSFASLLLAEGRTVHYVAAQLGHGAGLTLSTYGHLMAEYAGAERIDVLREIANARNTPHEIGGSALC